MAMGLLPRSLLPAIVTFGALQLFSLQLRRPKKELESEPSEWLSTVQGLCDRRSLSILAAALVLVSYLAFGHVIKRSRCS